MHRLVNRTLLKAKATPKGQPSQKFMEVENLHVESIVCYRNGSQDYAI